MPTTRRLARPRSAATGASATSSSARSRPRARGRTRAVTPCRRAAPRGSRAASVSVAPPGSRWQGKARVLGGRPYLDCSRPPLRSAHADRHRLRPRGLPPEGAFHRRAQGGWPRRRRPRHRLRGAGRLPADLRRRSGREVAAGRRRARHRARRQRPGRADLGQQGARRARRALQRPLHRRVLAPAQRRQRAVDRRPDRRGGPGRRDPARLARHTEFEGGRHQRRVDEITAIENGEVRRERTSRRRWSAPIPRSPTSSAARSSARTPRSS